MYHCQSHFAPGATVTSEGGARLPSVRIAPSTRSDNSNKLVDILHVVVDRDRDADPVPVQRHKHLLVLERLFEAWPHSLAREHHGRALCILGGERSESV